VFGDRGELGGKCGVVFGEVGLRRRERGEQVRRVVVAEGFLDPIRVFLGFFAQAVEGADLPGELP
jgi:hypothetical protein